MTKKNLKQKTFTAPLELKADGKQGEFKAVFATFNVEDHHGDITVPGAFEEQKVLVEPWNHGWTLPAGKGVIKSDDTEAWVEGEFFMDTEAGQEHYKTVKALDDQAEWSYTFDIIEADRGVNEGEPVRYLRKMDVVGVGPVTRGAGIDTRTVTIKSETGAGRPATDETKNEDEAASEDTGKSSDELMTRIYLLELDLIKHRLEI
jgi:hypothetical protein